MHPYLWAFLYTINLLIGFGLGGAMILPLYVYDIAGEDLSKGLAIVFSCTQSEYSVHQPGLLW